jgi:hypothetical protein
VALIMAEVDTVQLDVVWLHLDMTHARAADVLANAQQKCALRLPYAQLSVTYNLAGTEALVKVTATPAEIEQLPNLTKGAIIRTYTEADHTEADVMMDSPAWTGPPET